MANDTSRERGAPEGAVTRLSLYLRQLEFLHRKGTPTVSSSQLGLAVGCTPAQVRKDLAYFGPFGTPGVGYSVGDLAASIRRILGTHRAWKVALVGAGNLGTALLSYGGFAKRGFVITCAFDNDPLKVGRKIGGVKVQPVGEFRKCVRRSEIALGMIAVGAEHAQEVADMMLAAGIRGILSFAPLELKVPEDVILYTVDMAVKLEQITFHLARRQE